MSITLSSALEAKAVTLYSMTIDSPTNRVNKKGVAIRPTVYFDNPVKDKTTGKMVAGKKSTLYTPDADEAKALKAEQDACECVCLDGAGKYDPSNERHYRFMRSSLDDSLMRELRQIKGMLASNQTITDIKKALKRLAGAYINALPTESRCMVADAIATLTVPALDTLRTGSSTEEDTPLF